MIKYLIFISVAITFTSCLYVEQKSTQKSFFLKVKKDVELKINNGEMTTFKENESYKIEKIEFHSVRGGKTLLFGKFPIKEANGDQAKRLTLLGNGEVVAHFSLNELLKMDKYQLDDIEVIDLSNL